MQLFAATKNTSTIHFIAVTSVNLQSAVAKSKKKKLLKVLSCIISFRK